jgi:hypothetical protein
MHSLRRTATIVAALTASLLGLVAAAPSAFAMRLAPNDDSNPTTVATVTHAGMAGWQIALIALGAALAASVATIIVLRLRPRPAVHAASH